MTATAPATARVDHRAPAARPAMSEFAAHTLRVTQRHLRGLARQPWLIGVSLVQPIVWLLLFGALFRRVVDIPGFGGGDYTTFLTPGVLVLSAIFGGGWSGMNIVLDIDLGVMDRFLVTPMRRGALMAGLLVYGMITVVVQSAIIVGLGMATGADFDNTATGLPILLLSAVLLALGFASLSHALALVLRKQESVIAAVQFVALPLSFLSSAMMQQALAAPWVRHVADVNPVNWAVVAGRGALTADVDWPTVLSRLGYLAAFAAACLWLSLRAFRSYQRSA